LAVALVECALPAGVGAKVNLAGHELGSEYSLFGEDASRVIISCDPAKLARIQQVAADFEISADVLGETGSDQVEIEIAGKRVVSLGIEELRAAYEGALEKALSADPGVNVTN
jgi:phosphoribosylformylglycinamidine (FGAM) synthase-like enzyme